MTTANNYSDSKYVDYLDPLSLCWKRPKGPPRIWRVVKGRRRTASGEIPRFRIQEVPEELEDDAVDFILKYFVAEEPITAQMGVVNNPIAIRESRTIYKDIVRQGVSLVALTVNSDPAAKPVIAGVSLLLVVSQEDEANLKVGLQCRTECMKKIMEVELKFEQESDIIRKYGVDKYLSAFGLCVHPSFRGQGVGEELLRARDDVGLAYQIPACSTLFTGPASQILAARVGYEVLLEKNYSELLDDEGKVAFPGITIKSFKVMGKRLY